MGKLVVFFFLSFFSCLFLHLSSDFVYLSCFIQLFIDILLYLNIHQFSELAG